MQCARPHLARLAAIGLAVAAIACADSLGVGGRDLTRQRAGLAALSADSVPPDSSPPDTSPPNSAVLRGVVIGIDSSIVPPRFTALPRSTVVLYTRHRLPDSSWVPDSIGSTVTDSSGSYFFGGLAPRVYGLRAIPPRGSGYAPSTARARATVPGDSGGVPATNIYVYKRRS